MREIELRDACKKLALQHPDKFTFAGGNYLYRLSKAGRPYFQFTIRSKKAEEKLNKILEELK